MATKECPSCGATVPVEATRCKHCFHDFTEAPPKKGGIVGLLVMLSLMAALAAGVLGYIYSSRSQERIVVDEETRTVIITRKTAEATDTERVSFDEITQVESVMGGEQAMFEIVAVTKAGRRVVIQQSDDRPLKAHAEHLSHVMDKPFVEVSNVRGFGD